MNAVPNIERRESGPAYMDRASEEFEGYEAERAERELRAGFMFAAGRADANALCTWAPFTTDLDRCRLLHIATNDPASPKRAQTLTELMAESLDYGSGPSMTEAMQLILNVANGCATQQQARDLLARMGEAFARANS